MNDGRKLVGVLGGMGPLAAAEFLNEILDYTDADTDQENLDLVLSQHSSVPDRTDAIMGRGPDPTPDLIADAKKLQQWGVDFIVTPCNTVTHFMRAVRSAVSVEVVDIVQVTLGEAAARLPSVKTIGVLATAGSIQSKIFDTSAQTHGWDVIVPVSADQLEVDAMIYHGVKSGRKVAEDVFYRQVNRLLDAGADVVICGCTELSVIYRQLQVDQPRIVDSMDTLAKVTVEKAGYPLRRKRLYV